jgi:MFS family permease
VATRPTPQIAIPTGAQTGRTNAAGPLGAAALTAVVLGGQSMASLDASIVNVAAPAIRHGLHMSSATLQLAVYSYLLVYGASLVLAARYGARAGFGRTFIGGVALFTASSLACGLAPNAPVLVTARAVQGLGAALMVGQVLSILQVAFDGAARTRAMAFYGAVLALGVAVGQVLGGVLLEADILGAGWRPIFLVNVPVGVVVTVRGLGRLPAGPRTREGALDVRGAAALAGGMLALLVPRLRARGGTPLIDPALLGRSGAGPQLAGVFVLMACYGGLLFTAALDLQTRLHYSALRSGLTFAAYAAGFATASIIWGRLPARWHGSVPATALALLGACCVALAWATRTGWPAYATALLALAGASHGAGFGALVRRAGERITSAQTTAWSGLLATTGQLAIATGIALAGTIFQAGGLAPVLTALATGLFAAAATATAFALPKRRVGPSVT